MSSTSETTSPTLFAGAATGPILTVYGDEPLSPALISRITEVCEQAAEAGPSTVVLVRLGLPAVPEPAAAGAVPEPTAPRWPGGVGVHLVNGWERGVRRLERLAAPTVALARGHCGGPAVELLLACDYRVAGTDLSLSFDRSAAAGWAEPWPGTSLHRLANQVGAARTRALALFGGVADASHALRLGIVDEVVDEPVARSEAVVARARGLDGAELAVRRRLVLDATTTSFEESLGAHLAACDRTLRRDLAQRRDTPTGPGPS